MKLFFLILLGSSSCGFDQPLDKRSSLNDRRSEGEIESNLVNSDTSDPSRLPPKNPKEPADDACSSHPASLSCFNLSKWNDLAKNSEIIKYNQGVKLKIKKMIGNFMPGPVPSDSKIVPTETTAWIFKGKIKFDNFKESLIELSKKHEVAGYVQTDIEGQVGFPLEEGEYTIFAEFDCELSLNGIDGYGYYSTVLVEKNKITEAEIVNADDAVF